MSIPHHRVNSVVTRSGSGLGRSTCFPQARDELAVAVWDLNQMDAQDSVALIVEESRGLSVQCDVSSKASLAVFTKLLAVEFTWQLITANYARPHFIDTPMLREHFSDMFVDQGTEASMMGHLGKVEDIADAIANMCSKETKHINGHTLRVNGDNYMD